MANSMLKCQFCSFSSKILKHLRTHEKNEHFYASERISKKSENVKKKNHRENFKHFTCKFCPYTSNRNFNVVRHMKQNHWRKNEENVNVNIKREKQKDDMIKEKCETNKMNVDEKLEEELYRKICASRECERGREYIYISAFERKNEIGKEALEVIRKFGIDIEKFFEVIQKAIEFRKRIEKLEKRFTETSDETQRKEEKMSEVIENGNDIRKRIEKLEKRFTETADETQAKLEKESIEEI